MPPNAAVADEPGGSAARIGATMDRSISQEPEMNVITNSTVGIFREHDDAERAVKELQRSGFDMRKLSIVGKDFPTDQKVLGYYNTGYRIATWGKLGQFWGAILRIVSASAFFIIPGLGPIMIGGPIVALLVDALETAVATAGLTALGNALVSIGIPRDSALRYEMAIKAHRFVLVLHNSFQEAKRAKEILTRHHAEHAEVHGDATTPTWSVAEPA